jgi:hypothetical protein
LIHGEIGTGEHRKVRMKDVQILKVESFVFKKKKEYEREEGEGNTHEEL